MANSKPKMPGVDAFFGSPPRTGRPPLTIREETGDTHPAPTTHPEPPRSTNWESFDRPNAVADARTTTGRGQHTRQGPLGPVQANWAKFTMRVPPYLRVSLAAPKAKIAERTGRRTLSDQDLILALLDLTVTDRAVLDKVIARLDGDPS